MDVHQIATPVQTMRGSALLLEALLERGEKPDVLLLYTHIRRMRRESSDFDKVLYQAMPMSRAKVRMLLSFAAEDIPEAMLPAVYNRELLFGGAEDSPAQDVPGALAAEMAEIEDYYGRGFVSRTELAQMQDPARVRVGNYDQFTAASVTPSCEEALRRIAAMCRENGIELILLGLPFLPANVIATTGEGYHGFHAYTAALAEELGVPFWDLTYLRAEKAVIDSSCFIDARHGNARFSLRISRVLGDMLREHRAGTLETEAYLFDDYEEYLRQHRGINALYAGDTLRDGRCVNVNVALGADTAAEVRASIVDADGGRTLLRDWSAEKRVYLDGLPAGEYRLIFEGRQPGGEIEQTLEKVYTIP